MINSLVNFFIFFLNYFNLKNSRKIVSSDTSTEPNNFSVKNIYKKVHFYQPTKYIEKKKNKKFLCYHFSENTNRSLYSLSPAPCIIQKTFHRNKKKKSAPFPRNLDLKQRWVPAVNVPSLSLSPALTEIYNPINPRHAVWLFVRMSLFRQGRRFFFLTNRDWYQYRLSYLFAFKSWRMKSFLLGCAGRYCLAVIVLWIISLELRFIINDILKNSV